MTDASRTKGSDTEGSGVQPDSPILPANKPAVTPDVLVDAASSARHAATATALPPPSGSTRRHLWRTVALWVVFLLLVGSGALLWLRRDVVLDWVHTRNYAPPRAVVTLADETTMTAYGRRLFYVNYPVIQDKDLFNASCPDASHEVAVLGCYNGNRNGIYLYHVTDARLDGITQVTAAHEMLHQAFDRLSPSEKTRVSALLKDYYEHALTDTNIKEKIASYKKLEPNDLVNEMHSVFGTEVADLPPALETYYKQYFTDRSKVVAFRNHYVAAFSEREHQITAYDAQRDALKKQINQAQADLDAQEKSLRTQRDQMNAYLAADDVDHYNALVPGFNAQVASYKAKVAETNNLINEYNAITDKRNALTAQEQELLKAQDSHASSAAAE